MKIHLPRRSTGKPICGVRSTMVRSLWTFSRLPEEVQCKRCGKVWKKYINSQEPVHVTEVGSYLSCRLYWRFTAAKPRGLYLEPRWSVGPFSIGRVMHTALQQAADLTGQVQSQVLFDSLGVHMMETADFLSPEDEVDHFKVLNNLSSVLKYYEEWVEDVAPQYQLISTEMKVRGEFDGFPVTGRYDAMLLDKNTGEKWIMDYKSTSRRTTGWVKHSLQAVQYTAIGRQQFGEDLAGVIFRFFMKSRPKDWNDLILKSGKVTKAKKSLEGTTFYDLKEALIVAAISSEIGLPPEDAYYTYVRAQGGDEASMNIVNSIKPTFDMAVQMYYTELSALKRGNRYIFDVKVPISQVTQDILMNSLIIPAYKDMYSSPPISPTGSAMAWAQCARCMFHDQCVALMTGAPLDLSSYRERTDQEEVFE